MLIHVMFATAWRRLGFRQPGRVQQVGGTAATRYAAQQQLKRSKMFEMDYYVRKSLHEVKQSAGPLLKSGVVLSNNDKQQLLNAMRIYKRECSAAHGSTRKNAAKGSSYKSLMTE